MGRVQRTRFAGDPLILLLLSACTRDDDDERRPIPRDQRPDLGGNDENDDDGGEDEVDDDEDVDDDDTADDADADTDADADADADSDGDADADTDVADPSESCHPDIEGWAKAWAAFEEEVVVLVNRERKAGADCDTGGKFKAAGALSMDPYLRCAARYHSLWMAEEDEFMHESPRGDLGDDPWERIASTGFTGTAVGENIAAGYATAAEVVDGWMESDGHCVNIMNASARLIGVGYYEGGSWGTYWTQNFGS